MFPKLSVPKRGSITEAFSNLKTNIKEITKDMPIPIVTSMKQKKANHELAMKLWDLHANPILKGYGVEGMDKSGVVDKTKALPGKLSPEDLLLEKQQQQNFANMSKQDKMLYRENQKALRVKEKKQQKVDDFNAKAKKAAEKAHKKSTKKDAKAEQLEEMNERLAEKALEKKLKKKNLPEKEAKLQKLLLHNNHRMHTENLLNEKFGKGKITGKYGGANMGKRDKMRFVSAPVPDTMYGWTKGTENIMGVYKLGAEREGEKETRDRQAKERLEFERRKADDEVINNQANKDKKRAKKRRMRENGGIDPEDVEGRAATLMKGKKLVVKNPKKTSYNDDIDGESAAESSADENSDEPVAVDIDVDAWSDDEEEGRFSQMPRDADEEALMIAEEFRLQARETRNRLKKMGYKLDTKCCGACGSKTVGRPLDYWTGLPKGGKEDQWYAVGDQFFCYECANNATLMKGVAKALAVMNGFKSSEGIKNFSKIKKLKFKLDYNVDMTHEQNEMLNKIEETGPSIEILREQKRKAEIRRKLKEKRFEMENTLNNRNKKGKKRGEKRDGSVWWQQKRRREENMWHNEEMEKLDCEIKAAEKKQLSENDHLGIRVSKKSEAIYASHESAKNWFPAKYNNSLSMLKR